MTTPSSWILLEGGCRERRVRVQRVPKAKSTRSLFPRFLSLDVRANKMMGYVEWSSTTHR